MGQRTMTIRYAVPTAPRPDGEGWRKVPEVTYGGAPDFWHRRNPETDALERYAYDRIEGRWRLSGESVWSPAERRYIPDWKD